MTAQELRKIIRQEIEAEGKRLQERLEAEIKLSRMEIQNILSDIEDRIKNLEIKQSGLDTRFEKLEIRLEKLEAGQKKILKDVSYIKKTIDVMISSFDREDVRLLKRVQRIEEKLGLPRAPGI